jgi:ribonuclease Z
MQITILGNASGGPFHGRPYSAQLVQLDNQVYMVDCGEGTQMQIFKHRLKADACRQLFISHLHGDHIFGLLGMLTNWGHKKRSEPLQLFSPPGLQEFIETSLRICGVKLSYALEFVEVDASVSACVYENPKLEVWSIPLRHRCPTSGWLFREKTRPRTIRPEKIEQYQIPFDLIPGIKAGDDLVLPHGATIPNAELTLDPPAPKSYAYCSDTAFHEPVIEVVQGVDLLYHEATFTSGHHAEAEISMHSTAAQAAEVAKRAGVGRLLLGHFSGRYANTDLHLAEARLIFGNADIAEEGHVYLV